MPEFEIFFQEVLFLKFEGCMFGEFGMYSGKCLTKKEQRLKTA